MKITFTNSITVGDIQHQVSISSLQLKSMSFNLAGPKGPPNVLVSITLTDPVSGHDEHFVYEDSTLTPAFFSQATALQVNGAPWLQMLLQRLITDGKLPTGTISN
jgi:hypothetical protein